jgi:hypothetical protein
MYLGAYSGKKVEQILGVTGLESLLLSYSPGY